MKVLVADDDDIVREVIVEVLADDGRFEVVGTAAEADSAIEIGQAAQPALALVDVKMPGGGGPRIARELRERSPATRVVALSSYDDRRAIMEMFRAGAVSYLVKGEATNAEIVSTLLRVAEGELALPNTVADQLLDELSMQLERSHRDVRQRGVVEARLRNVLATGAVDMAYQPIVGLAEGRMVGVEALARFATKPPRTPDRWFREAASVGLGLELELLAARSALGALDELETNVYLGLNVSPETAGDAGFQALVLDAAPERTVIEITEHAPIGDYDEFARSIEPLRMAGVRVAVDDAGAGFASLRHILSLAPDIIKLDITLTRDIDVDRSRRALARALISFGAETGAALVAEGIETDDELECLRDLGVTAGQGYLLGRPGPLEP